MRSKVADEVRGEQRIADRAMDADERLRVALELGEQAIADYVRNFGVDRTEAVRVLRRAGQAGRRHSACNEELDGRNQRGR